MSVCPTCGGPLEKPKEGWIEKWGENPETGKGDRYIGRFTKWDQSLWKGGLGMFAWVEEWRLGQLNGEYCPKGHLGMKTVEEELDDHETTTDRL